MTETGPSSRYRIDGTLEEGCLAAFDVRLQRHVVLCPKGLPGQVADVHDIITLNGQDYLVVEAGPQDEDETGRRTTAAGRRRVAAAIVVGLVVCAVGAVGAVMLLGSGDDAARRSLHVLLLPPRIEGTVRSTVVPTMQAAVTNLLAAQEGTFVLDGEWPKEQTEDKLRGLMTASGADQLLYLVLGEGQLGLCPVEVILMNREGGGSTADCEVSCSEPQLSSETVVATLRTLYPDRKARKGATASEATPEQYAEYLNLRTKSLNDNTFSYPAYLERLFDLSRRAPRLLRVYASEISVAAYLAKRNNDPDYLSRAREALDRFRELAPNDFRVTLAALDLALAEEDVDQVRGLVQQLETQAADHPHLPRYQARLAELEGDLPRGIAILERANNDRVTIENLRALSDLAYKSGDLPAARGYFRRALTIAPDDSSVIQDQARIELASGDPLIARELYFRLMSDDPQAILAMNLGVTYLLTGDYETALEHFNQAKRIGLRSYLLTVNTADCLRFLGDDDAADAAYRQALQMLASGRPTPEIAAYTAHCLAQLGQADAALEKIAEALDDSPNVVDVVVCAAMVYRRVGDTATSQIYVKKARGLGISDAWLGLPFLSG